MPFQCIPCQETREDYDEDEDEAPEAVECNICMMLLNGPGQYRDHVTGKRHRKNQRRGRCFRAWKSVLEITRAAPRSGATKSIVPDEAGAVNS